MSDGIVTGDSVEAAAFALFMQCNSAASRSIDAPARTEDDILALYGRCLAAARGHTHNPVNKPSP